MCRTFRLALTLLLAVAPEAASAQSADWKHFPNAFDKAFLSQGSQQLMISCIEASRTLGGIDGDPDHMVERGWVYLAAGNREKAEAIFQQAIRAPHTRTETYRYLGLAWLHQGLKAEALQAFGIMGATKKSNWAFGVPNNPGGPPAGGIGAYSFFGIDTRKGSLARSAVDMLRSGLIKEATDCMDQVYLTDADDSDDFIQFAHAALIAGQQDLAARYFAYAVKASPKDKDVWVEITQAYSELLTKKDKEPQ